MAESAQPPEDTTIIAEGALLEGKLTVRGALRVEGAVLGTIRSKGEVCVSSHGRVLGDVHGAVLDVAGRIDGIVAARAALHVASTGRLYGHARYQTLSVERGGVMNCSSYQRDEPSHDELDDAAQ